MDPYRRKARYFNNPGEHYGIAPLDQMAYHATIWGTTECRLRMETI
jgi:hypothetical protein